MNTLHNMVLIYQEDEPLGKVVTVSFIISAARIIMNYITDNSGRAIRFSETSFSRAFNSHKPRLDGLHDKFKAVSKSFIFPDI